MCGWPSWAIWKDRLPEEYLAVKTDRLTSYQFNIIDLRVYIYTYIYILYSSLCTDMYDAHDYLLIVDR